MTPILPGNDEGGPGGCRDPLLRAGSDGADVLRLRALLALRHVELDPLGLVERAVAGTRDRREVAEDVGTAAVLLDEAEALLRVEPLRSALSHVVLLQSCWGDRRRLRAVSRVAAPPAGPRAIGRASC